VDKHSGQPIDQPDLLLPEEDKGRRAKRQTDFARFKLPHLIQGGGFVQPKAREAKAGQSSGIT
jgi:hypothetical protein